MRKILAHPRDATTSGVVTFIYANTSETVLAFQLNEQPQWYEIGGGPNYTALAGMIFISKSTSKLAQDQWQLVNFDGTTGQGVVGLVVNDLYLS